MAAATPLPPSASPELPKLSNVQKLAALLVMLGPESASQLLKGMEEAELETVSLEMAKLPMISPTVQAEVLKEFAAVVLDVNASVRGGLECVQSALEKAVGAFKASNILSRVSTSAPVEGLRQIVACEPREIFNLIKHEQAQTCALVLSFLAPDRASQTVAMLPEQDRHQVLERMATLAPTPIDALEKVVHVLVRKLGGGTGRTLNQSGGVKAAADLLNALDKSISKSVLGGLEARNPDLGQAIRRKMFIFDDLAKLESGALQRILREVDPRELAVALKTANEPVRNTLLACLSKRAADNVREEISFMGALKSRDIDAAQTRIIGIVRRLEAEGEIEIERSEPDNAL